MLFVVIIACVVIVFFVRKEDDKLTILKKIAYGVILSIVLGFGCLIAAQLLSRF
jgi:hypothetical protein